MAEQLTEFDRAWARFFREQFDNISVPEPLVMMAIKQAFRVGYQSAQQGVQAELLTYTGPEHEYCHKCDNYVDDCQCQPAIGLT